VGAKRLIVLRGPMWQSLETVKRRLHHCFVVLGLLAMAMALAAIPVGIALVSSKTPAGVEMAHNGDDAMPCHHPCPGCAKLCPDMGTCLLKCFQQLPPLPEQLAIEATFIRNLVPLGQAQRIAEAPIPPLLRPPSV